MQKLDHGAVAMATAANIESAPTVESNGNVIAGLAVLLGRTGIIT
jgi:hypothetical protein